MIECESCSCWLHCKCVNISSSISKSSCKFWSHVRSLRKNKDSIPTLISNSTTFASDVQKAQILSDTFSNNSCPPLLPHITEHSFCPNDFLCSTDEIISLINSLPNRTSCGPDGISSIMLKYTAPSVAYTLMLTFNQSISSGTLPASWKHSNITPIPKSSPPSSSPSDYRPISLLSVISKLLERHIYNILLDFVQTHSLIADNQFGFLPSRSTFLALLSSTHSILSALDSHSSICGTFLDLCKAFDSVPHSPLIDLLASYNLPAPLLSWLRSYLSCHTQSVVLNGISSSHTHAISGVPQGSILGPLLFLVYINGLCDLPLLHIPKCFDMLMMFFFYILLILLKTWSKFNLIWIS